MKFIGKFGEHLALSRLLEHSIEAYPAIKVNQDSYDLTAIDTSGKAIRIQVKATELHNRSTNNAIGTLEGEFDFLVVVVVLGEHLTKCFVLTRVEALEIKGPSKSLGISRIENEVPVIKESFLPYEEKWNKIGVTDLSGR